MWKLFAVDFEAQDEDPKTTLPTEFGGMLVEYTENPDPTMVELERYEQLLFCENMGYKAQSEKVIELTGITDDMLRRNGVDPVVYLRDIIFPVMERADFILAHNKKYDETLFNTFCRRMGLTPPEKVWICSYQDIPYPAKYTCKKLSHLALDHKIKMDDRELHRVTGDVELLLEVVKLYKFSVILKYASTPWVFIKVEVPKPWHDNGVGKDLAKKLGFGWQQARGTDEPFFDQSWVKRVKVDQLETELQCMPGYNNIR